MNSLPSKARIEEVRRLIEKATKGRWRAGRADMQSIDEDDNAFTNVYSDDEAINPCVKHHVTGTLLPHVVARVMDEAGNNKADAALIAQAPQLAQELLNAMERIEELEEQISRLEGRIATMCDCYPIRHESHETTCPYRNGV